MVSLEMKLVIFLCFIFAARIYQLTATGEKCVTSTKYGVLRGKMMTSHSGRVFCTFLGIPYADPPIGKLRFLPPTSAKAWEGIKNCTEESMKCLQKHTGGSEDCLYLNIFTHSPQTNNSFTVMFYIHGGGFYMGSSTLRWLGPEYFMDKDIVLVILQYRLGPFGFLSTEDEVIPGNMGLKDQVKALQWVQENIEQFGGNPAKVTIFGNSAGGASVHYHMQSPISRELFARAISQSGTVFSSFAMTGEGRAKETAKDLALELNCPVDDSSKILRCLQNKSSSEISEAFRKKLKSKYGDSQKLFRPVVEEQTEYAFVTSNYSKLKTDKQWLIGLVANEGLFKINLEMINKTIGFIDDDFENFGPHAMGIGDLCASIDEITNLTYQFYFGNVSSAQTKMESLEHLVTDSWFAWPTEKAIEKHEGLSYYYLYDHRAEHTYSQLYGIKPLGYGVCHTDELHVLFTQKGFFPDLNQEDTNISKMMIDMWVNFASEGNPTPNAISKNPQKEDSDKIIWEPSNRSNPRYIHIKTNNLSMKDKLFYERMNFWRQLYLRNVDGA